MLLYIFGVEPDFIPEASTLRGRGLSSSESRALPAGPTDWIFSPLEPHQLVLQFPASHKDPALRIESTYCV